MTALIAILWVLSGVGTWALVCYLDWRNGGDITVEDLIAAVLCAIFGLVVPIFVGVIALMENTTIKSLLAENTVAELISISIKRVLIRGKSRG